MAFKLISLLWIAKGVIMGHVGDTGFFVRAKKPCHQVTWVMRLLCTGKKKQKKKKQKHITTFGALGGLVFDPAYDIKQANLSQRKMYDK